METDEQAIEHERTDHHDDAQPPKYEEAQAPDPVDGWAICYSKGASPAQNLVTRRIERDQ